MMTKPSTAVSPIEKRAMPEATDGSTTATPRRRVSPASQPIVRWL